MKVHPFLVQWAEQRDYPSCPACGTRCVVIDLGCCGFCPTCETWRVLPREEAP